MENAMAAHRGGMNVPPRHESVPYRAPAGRGHASFPNNLIYNDLQNKAWKRSLFLAAFPRSI